MALDFAKIVDKYDFDDRQNQGLTENHKVFSETSSEALPLLVGFGGTISSGYSPQKESILPLNLSPAVKQVEYIKMFGINEQTFQSLDLVAKDSRDLLEEDIFQLLDVVRLVKNRQILITAGTYMLPKIASVIQKVWPNLDKVVVLTGSILPAGFMGSDADANVWSSITTMGYAHKHKTDKNLKLMLVFHGKVFEGLKTLENLDLHPPKTQKIVIQYPLSTVLTDYEKKI